MHPIEHLLYFSVVLIHWVVPSHPLHFLFNAQHTALTPAPGHTGFEGKLGLDLSNYGVILRQIVLNSVLITTNPKYS